MYDFKLDISKFSYMLPGWTAITIDEKLHIDFIKTNNNNIYFDSVDLKINTFIDT